MKTIPIQPLSNGGRRPVASPIAELPGSKVRWQLSTLLQAPHRLSFAAGVTILAVSSLWWALLLSLSAMGIPVHWAVPRPIAHSVLMAFGYMPLYFIGFLFTAGPKWLGQPAVEARVLLCPVATYVLAWLGYMVAVHLDADTAAVCVALAAAAWTSVVVAFARLVTRSRAEDRTHAKLVLVGILTGAVALWCLPLALALEAFTVARIAVLVGIWGCMAIVYVAVSHRMIPFFTANVVPMLNAWRPMWLLGVFVGVLGLELIFSILDLTVWPLGATVRFVQMSLELASATVLLTMAVKWGLMQSLRARLLVMLHVGFVWLGLAVLLQAISHGLMFATDDALSLGLAPTHALTMGFMGATLFAMATRVSAGHSGRHLVADDLIWTLFWIQQIATVLRIVAAAWPSSLPWLTPLAASLWALASISWALRYGLWYGRPREDGKPG